MFHCFDKLIKKARILGQLKKIQYLNILAQQEQQKKHQIILEEYLNWHPFFMCTAFVLFITPAIVSFELYPFPRNYNENIHCTLMTFSIILSFAGLSIILDYHNNLTYTGSFLTFNGCDALLTLIILSINYIGAFIMYIYI